MKEHLNWSYRLLNFADGKLLNDWETQGKYMAFRLM
jgi:hypothetical protein